MTYDLNGLEPLDHDDIVRLPAEALAYVILPRLRPSKAFRRSEMIEDLGGGKGLSIESRNVAAALQVLVHDGVLVMWPYEDPRYRNQGGDMMMVTAWGDRVHAAGEHARSMASARRRLSFDLHPMLAPKLRDSIAVGAFENAAMLGLRTVESRVRRLCDNPKTDQGVRLTAGPLMDYAFKAKGPLADPGAEKGEREGQMFFFKGAFLAVRNVLNHTDEEQWSDSIEAAEYVLLADLLMRRLDHVEQRLALETKATEAAKQAQATADAAGLAGALVVAGAKAITRTIKG